MSKVMLIEDDDEIRQLYSRVFALEGLEIEAADNGLSALEQLQVYTPDLILLDIMMPTMNGMEFLDKLKADPATQNIPVIVLTNMADMNVTNSALAKGAVLCIIKSQTEPDQVVATVKGLLDKPQTDASGDQHED
jgi:twitching motility two-component system response regulator PilH